jgi:3-oxoadipate enol-lactonase
MLERAERWIAMDKVSSRLLPTSPRISVAASGVGEALMFLHGLGSTKENWYPQLIHFGQTHRAMAWDAPGYGESDDHEGELAFARDFVSALLSTLDLLGVERVHLAGLSMGGMIAQCFYFAHPHRVASLILADTFPRFQAIGTDVVKGFIASRIEPLMRGATPADLAPASAESLLAPDAPESARTLLLESMSNLRSHSYVVTALALAVQDAVGNLEDIAVPTLVLSGALDRLTPVPIARAMEERIPGAQLVIIPGAGHISNLESPERFNAALSRFLSTHSGVATELD